MVFEMLYLDVILSISIVWVVAVISPGPNFFLVVYTAVKGSKSMSIFTIMGIVTGTFVWSLLGFLGIALIFSTFPLIYFYLKILGGIYLIGIGVKLLSRKEKHVSDISSRHRSALSCFLAGFLTNVLNPKTVVFITSMYAATIPVNASLAIGLICVATLCIISGLWYSLVSVIFFNESARRLYLREKGKIEAIAGTIFIGFGLKLAIL